MPVTVSIRRLQPLRSQLPDTDGAVDIVAGPLAGEARGDLWNDSGTVKIVP